MKKSQIGPSVGLCSGTVTNAEKSMPKPLRPISHSKPLVDAALIVRVIVGLSLAVLSLAVLWDGMSTRLSSVISSLVN